MKRAVWITLLAILAFAVILIARLPINWVAGFIPKNISCTELAGSVWNGSCTGLVAQNIAVGDASWDLKPLALLTGKVSGYVEVTRGANFARGDIQMSGNDFSAQDLQIDMPIDPQLIPQLPRDLTGVVRGNLASIRVEKGIVTSVEGLVEAHDLMRMFGGQRVSIGDYSLIFPAADPTKEPVGQLRSLSGPLDVEGTLRLTRAPGFVAEGLVKAAADAPPQLTRDLAYLGSPDAEGRRPFSFENTF